MLTSIGTFSRLRRDCLLFKKNEEKEEDNGAKKDSAVPKISAESVVFYFLDVFYIILSNSSSESI